MAMRAGDTVSPNVGTYCLRRTNGVARLFRGGSFSEPQSKTPRLKTRATGKMRPTRRECGGISFSRHAARSQHPVGGGVRISHPAEGFHLLQPPPVSSAAQPRCVRALD